MSKDKILTKEEKKQRVRDYLYKCEKSENLEEYSFFEISKHTNIPEKELYGLLDSLENDKTIINEVAEFDIYLQNTQQNKDCIKILRQQSKLRPVFQDSLKLIVGFAFVAALFFIAIFIWAEKIDKIFAETPPAFIVFVFTYFFLIISLVISGVIKKAYDWFLKIEKKIIVTIILSVVTVVISIFTVVAAFSRTWEAFSALLFLLLGMLSLMQDIIRSWIGKIFSKTNGSKK